MLPVVTLVGRPNVGKSTLFNRLTRSRDALVADVPGLTRDRQYGEGEVEGRHFIVIDSGGLNDIATGLGSGSGAQSAKQQQKNIDAATAAQSMQAIREADVCLLLVDARDGLTPADSQLFHQLRKQGKNTLLAVNKTDGLEPEQACAEFHSLGAECLYPLSASQGRGVRPLLQAALESLPAVVDTVDAADTAAEVSANTPADPDQSPQPATIRIALIGRPNVGKSTLANRMLGEERVVVFDEPGTTRDSIHIPFRRRGRDYMLIDTAGVRRRGKTHEMLEKFSVVKSLQAVQAADVVVLVLDAQSDGDNRGGGGKGIVEQDLHLLGYAIEAGRALVIAMNKWDGLEQEAKDAVKKELRRRLSFADYVALHFISAKHGTGVGDLYRSIHRAFDSARRPLSTAMLTRILQSAVKEHAPPMVGRRRIKLRYAHPSGNQPPTVVVHGKQTERLPAHYSRYLENYYRKALQLEGTPLRVRLHSDENPFV